MGKGVIDVRDSLHVEHAEALDDLVGRILPLVGRFWGMAVLFFGEPDGGEYTINNELYSVTLRRVTPEESANYMREKAMKEEI